MEMTGLLHASLHQQYYMLAAVVHTHVPANSRLSASIALTKHRACQRDDANRRDTQTRHLGSKRKQYPSLSIPCRRRCIARILTGDMRRSHCGHRGSLLSGFCVARPETEDSVSLSGLPRYLEVATYRTSNRVRPWLPKSYGTYHQVCSLPLDLLAGPNVSLLCRCTIASIVATAAHATALRLYI